NIKMRKVSLLISFIAILTLSSCSLTFLRGWFFGVTNNKCCMDDGSTCKILTNEYIGGSCFCADERGSVCDVE
ncbi:MAG: hypothetical protein KDK90_22630, partial [Leptospiraceae bacterium]|nr:hypothetical protein [Leptospiraceae bacterium]